MKLIKINIELVVPNSVARRAERVGVVVFKDGTRYCAKVEEYVIDKKKSSISFEVTNKNGNGGQA